VPELTIAPESGTGETGTGSSGEDYPKRGTGLAKSAVETKPDIKRSSKYADDENKFMKTKKLSLNSEE
jgi:hypothetical protein